MSVAKNASVSKFLVIAVCLQSGLFFIPSASSADAKKDDKSPSKELFKTAGILKRIGPLHMSDAVLLRRGDEVVVLSDANDPINEAELAGCIIGSFGTESGSTVASGGTILFMKGASLPALDDGRNAEHLRLKDGRMIDGRIQWVRNGAIGILERHNLRIVQFSEIAVLVSPRAFQFSSLTQADQASSGQLNFVATADTPPSKFLAEEVNPMKARLTKHSLASKAALTAASAAAIGACFALPIVVGVVTPKLNNNSGGGSSVGGSSSSSSSSGGSN